MRLLNAKLPPIAMLHYVSDSIDVSLKGWSITHRSFLQLLDYLENNNYQTACFYHFAENDTSLQDSSKKIILTFDDCPKLLFDFAIRELLKRGMKAVFFIPTANIGGCNSWDIDKGSARLDIMNEEDLKELSRQGMEIGSHSHHHVELKKINSRKKIEEEIGLSKKILETITQKPVYSFAYPYGSVPDQYEAILSNAGYRFGVSIYQRLETNFALRRFGVYDKDTRDSLSLKLSPKYKWLRAAYDFTKKYN